MMTEDMITTRWHYRLLLTVYKLPLHHLLVFLLLLASAGLLAETRYQPLLQGSQSKTRNEPTLNEVLVNCTIELHNMKLDKSMKYVCQDYWNLQKQ